jgi:hypothetical protein
MKIVEHNNKCLTDDELVIRERERKKKASLYRKQYYEKNKEKIRAKAKQKLEKRKKIIDPETGLSLTQLDQKKYWKNYKKNNPNWSRKNGRRATYQRKYREENIERIRERDRISARKRKEALLNQRRIRDFGITTADYQKMFKEQNGTCLICNKEQKVNGKKHLFIDHDHKTEQVRGLLCNYCNSLLGFCFENKNILKDAITYLDIFDEGKRDDA